MRSTLIAAIAASAFLGAATRASADVQLTIQDGRVTLLAKDATVKQILTEWARVGQTKIVNVERIPGGPVTLELRDVPEQQALRVLLRSLGGYVTAPRTTAVANASMFDRILVMPVVAPPPAPVSAAPAAPSPPPFATFQPPQFQPSAQDDDRDDAPPPGAQPVGVRPPVFAFPPAAAGGQPQAQPVPIYQPATAMPARPATSTTFPGAPTQAAPVGSTAPGMLVPAPAPAPGIPGAPGAVITTPVGPGIQPRTQ